MFLTTNRAQGIDVAVQSRLTLALRYESLNAEARRQIWTNLLRTSSGHSSFDVQALAAVPLNGRQIKNCIRLSLALAIENGESLSQQLLSSTLDTIAAFQQDLRDEDGKEAPVSAANSSQASLQCALAAVCRENEALRAENTALRAELGAGAAGSALGAIRENKDRHT